MIRSAVRATKPTGKPAPTRCCLSSVPDEPGAKTTGFGGPRLIDSAASQPQGSPLIVVGSILTMWFELDGWLDLELE